MYDQDDDVVWTPPEVRRWRRRYWRALAVLAGVATILLAIVENDFDPVASLTAIGVIAGVIAFIALIVGALVELFRGGGPPPGDIWHIWRIGSIGSIGGAGDGGGGAGGG